MRSKLIAYSVTSFFFNMYYILSSDASFPDDSSVAKALGSPSSPASLTILDKCRRLFWFCPAKSLRGILPGVLDKWDQAYNEHISAVEGAARCDCHNDEWMGAYTAYAKAVVTAYETAAQTATFITVPQRAVARLRFYLLGMMDFHSASIFPTASVIKEELESPMKAVEFAFADVSAIIIIISRATTQHLQCRDKCA
jgi:hypothetical protein